MKHVITTATAAAMALTLAACGGNGITEPTEVELGETTFLFAVNPTVNDATEDSVPVAGPDREGVDISLQDGSLQDGPSGSTGTDGVSVVAGVDTGSHSVLLDDGGGNTG